jgi:hypothetical protein
MLIEACIINEFVNPGFRASVVVMEQRDARENDTRLAKDLVMTMAVGVGAFVGVVGLLKLVDLASKILPLRFPFL